MISGNTISNFPPNTTDESTGIYLDDETSNVLVTGNTVFGIGRYALIVHGGDHNTIRGNTFRIDSMFTLGLYQDDEGAGGTNYGMAGNVFTANDIYSSSQTTPSALWDFLDQSKAGITKPSDSGNTYHTPRANLPSLGPIVDTSPTVVAQ